MNNFLQFIDKNFSRISIVLLILLLLRTCGNDSKSINKRLDTLSAEVKSLKDTVVTKTDLEVEGLKAEKRMIQSTDRKLLDVNRQSQIDVELKKLNEAKWEK
jgi:ABC-type enterochelin transport system substrate-binding protein